MVVDPFVLIEKQIKHKNFISIIQGIKTITEFRAKLAEIYPECILFKNPDNFFEIKKTNEDISILLKTNLKLTYDGTNGHSHLQYIDIGNLSFIDKFNMGLNDKMIFFVFGNKMNYEKYKEGFKLKLNSILAKLLNSKFTGTINLDENQILPFKKFTFEITLNIKIILDMLAHKDSKFHEINDEIQKTGILNMTQSTKKLEFYSQNGEILKKEDLFYCQDTVAKILAGNIIRMPHQYRYHHKEDLITCIPMESFEFDILHFKIRDSGNFIRFNELIREKLILLFLQDNKDDLKSFNLNYFKIYIENNIIPSNQIYNKNGEVEIDESIFNLGGDRVKLYLEKEIYLKFDQFFLKFLQNQDKYLDERNNMIFFLKVYKIFNQSSKSIHQILTGVFLDTIDLYIDILNELSYHFDNWRIFIGCLTSLVSYLPDYITSTHILIIQFIKNLQLKSSTNQLDEYLNKITRIIVKSRTSCPGGKIMNIKFKDFHNTSKFIPNDKKLNTVNQIFHQLYFQFDPILKENESLKIENFQITQDHSIPLFNDHQLKLQFETNPFRSLTDKELQNIDIKTFKFLEDVLKCKDNFLSLNESLLRKFSQLEYINNTIILPETFINSGIKTYQLIDSKRIYQEFILTNQNCLYSAEQGLGKTLITISLCNIIFYLSKFPILYICSGTLFENVKKEFEIWNKKLIPGGSIPIISILDRQQLDTKKRVIDVNDWKYKSTILIMSPGVLSIIFNEKDIYQEYFNNIFTSNIVSIIDEGHLITQNESIIISKLKNSKLVLTGTPSKCSKEIWNPILTILNLKNNNFQTNFIRRTWVSLKLDSKFQYSDQIFYIKNDTKLEKQKHYKSQQIDASLIFKKKETLKYLIIQSKLINQKLIITSEFIETINDLELLFLSNELTIRFKYFRIDGNTSIKDRIHMINEFNLSSDFSIIILTDVGAVGLNFYSNLIIFTSPTYNYDIYDQWKKRIMRLSSNFNCLNWITLVLEDSIEERALSQCIIKNRDCMTFLDGINFERTFENEKNEESILIKKLNFGKKLNTMPNIDIRVSNYLKLLE